MGETGKRSRLQKNNDGDIKNQKRRTENNDKGDDELIVYRILCPDGFIGSVIGKGGKVINSIRQETRAKVKVVDPFPGAKDRVITIYCYVKEKEEVEGDDDCNDENPLCPAQDALMKVHAAIANAVTNVESEKRWKDKEECNILVPASQSAIIIGKSGATIKKLRSQTKANIKVTAKDASDPAHSCAMEFDNFVQITGETDAVKKALFAVSAIMYKFTPGEEIPLETTVPEAPPSILVPSDVPIYPASGFYPGADPIIPASSLPSAMGSHIQELPGYADTGSSWPVYSSALPLVSGYGGASRSEELIIRVLCPNDKIGRVIGKGGASIKSIRQASGARVDVDDKKDKGDECVITVTSTESADDLKSVAVEAVLLLQEKINDEETKNVSISLLVSPKVIGCIIGRSGSIINEIRKRTKAEVKISKGRRPRSADANDEHVEVVGEVGHVRDALVQIVLRLREVALKDKDHGRNPSAGADSVYTAGGGLSMPPVLPAVSSVAPPSYEHRSEVGTGLGRLPSGSLYGYGSLSMEDEGYRSVPSYSTKLYGGAPPLSTLEMLIPGNAVGRVIGKGGVNLANIRQISGAVIEISESKSSRGDRVAHISGTSDQKRSAENLIQAFILAT
ncbi:hypothetical protein Nepgr_023684 [Nepenthes gracilis]|uniref:K Homology domain-containing protein n=1 Tax=Nepenthes gracilis TaxID=150966 RepID=A0AAD3XZP1_NEPGR|nr:hypothetical protein Nepgr_023684 [Nepenthes gracilis]